MSSTTLNLRGGLPGKNPAVPVDCGDQATLTNTAGVTVYYRAATPVTASANDGSLAVGDTVDLVGTQYLAVDGGTSSSALDTATVTLVSGPETEEQLITHEQDDTAHDIPQQLSNRVTTGAYLYVPASPNLGATQSRTLSDITPDVLVGTLNQNLTVTYSNFVQGSHAKIVGQQDGTGSHTLTITDGVTPLTVTIPSTASAKFSVWMDTSDSLHTRVLVFSTGTNAVLDWTRVAPTPPNPGVRENRGPGGTTDKALLASAFTDNRATGTVNAADTSTAVPELAGYASTPGTRAILSVYGFSPVVFIDENNKTPTAVAYVNNKGELTSQNSTKARVLQQVGVPIVDTYVAPGNVDDPYTAFSPAHSVTDAGGGPTNGQTYTGQIWDCWRLRTAGTTWDATTSSRTATRTITGVATTNGSASVTFGSGQITNSDSGMTLAVTGLPANTYVVSVAGTTATMSANATATGTGKTGSLKPTDPRLLSYTYEVQNAARYLDLANNPGYPIDRYPFATSAPQLAVAEAAAWGATATKLGYMPLMVLEEDIRRYIASGLIPKHAVGMAVPKRPATHRWPAQANDPIGPNTYDPNSKLEEGTRFRLNMGVGETAAASMPLTDAAIEALALHPVAEMTAKQVARYGFVIWDSGGAVTFRCQPEVANYFGGTAPYLVYSGFPWSKLEVLNTGSQGAPNP